VGLLALLGVLLVRLGARLATVVAHLERPCWPAGRGGARRGAAGRSTGCENLFSSQRLNFPFILTLRVPWMNSTFMHEKYFILKV